MNSSNSSPDYFLQHFDHYKSQCKCDPPCLIDEHLPSSRAFYNMNEPDRVNAVRFMLLPLTSPPSKRNELLRSETTRRVGSKRKRQTEIEVDHCLESQTNSKHMTTYAFRGQRLCRNAFAAIVHLCPNTINIHSKEICSTTEVSTYNPRLSSRRKDISSPQTKVVLTFLDWYGSEFGLECPTGRGSTEDSPLLLLSSDTTKGEVYKSYVESWESMMTYLISTSSKSYTSADEPLSLIAFSKLWYDKRNYMKIMKAGTDYCDTCVELTNLIRTIQDDQTKSDTKLSLLKHKDAAQYEFNYYVNLKKEAECNSNSDKSLHLIFDYAEKVLLPRLKKQPGQLHFVTSLKIDMFGVHVSHLKETDIYCLTEGHWPNCKTADTVASMLSHSIHRAKTKIGREVKNIKLHADNCGGQNKNRFMLWYFLWRVTINLEHDIELYFLVAGHTKNRVDGSFGSVKRKLKQKSVETPSQMAEVIDNSSECNRVVYCDDVYWSKWKDFLSNIYTIPSSFKITKYHIFKFNTDDFCNVKVKQFSTQVEWETFRLLKPSLTKIDVLNLTASDFSSEQYKLSITPLEEVASAHEGNRKQYLKKNILYKYYKDNSDFEKKYFSSGNPRHD